MDSGDAAPASARNTETLVGAGFAVLGLVLALLFVRDHPAAGEEIDGADAEESLAMTAA